MGSLSKRMQQALEAVSNASVEQQDLLAAEPKERLRVLARMGRLLPP